MPNFTRELPDEDWYVGRRPGVSTALRNMDEKSTKAANGHGGSTHAPTATITVIGKGFGCAGLWTFEGAFTTGAGLYIEHGAGHAADFLRLDVVNHPGRNREQFVRPLPCAVDTVGGTLGTANDPTHATTRFPGAQVLFPIDPHDGSRFRSCRLRFRIPQTVRTSVPNVPKFRVIRVDMDGNVEALHTSRSGNYLDGGYLPVPQVYDTEITYVDGGLAQDSQIYDANQNDVVDRSKYAYFVDFVEESGAGTFSPNVTLAGGNGTVVQSITTFVDTIRDMRHP